MHLSTQLPLLALATLALAGAAAAQPPGRGPGGPFSLLAMDTNADGKLTRALMPLGGGDLKPVIEALEKHRKFLRGEIAHRVNLKFAPDVRFKIDESFENSAKIDALLRRPEVQRDLGQKAEDERD